jgi:mutator protein MutT
MKRGVDYIGVGVGAVIVDAQGRLFFARRGPQAKNERGLWEFPGGSVEFGETLADALKREMREEYGIEIAVGELLDVVDHILPAEGQHWVSPAFICKVVSGEPHICEPGKCSEIGWFRPDQAPENLTVITRENLSNYRKKIMHHITSLGHAEAWKAIEVIQEEMLKRGRTGVIAIVDGHGELIALLRVDGAPLTSVQIAANKAYTAARERKPSRDVGQRSRDPNQGFDIAFFGDPKILGWGGGLPVMFDGTVVGAVGVSGLPEDEDIELAQMGVNAILTMGSESK